MIPTFFSSQFEFRAWLEANHQSASELIVGYWKVSTGKPSMTWSESVDQALCFGWIDGVRRKVDEESYCIRFTPRRPKSIWSAVNIAKIAELTEKGLMKPAGIEAFDRRGDKNSGGYRFKEFSAQFPPHFEFQFKENAIAWEFFESQPPGYRRIASFWVMSAKLEATRKSRLERLIEASSNSVRL